MRILHEAICRWQRGHGTARWPAGLSVLPREGLLADVRVLACPLADARSDYRFDSFNPAVLSSSQAYPESNYNYEFNGGPVPRDQLGDLPPMQNREAKVALMATALGGRVPILRCGKHAGVKLNLGADGRGYVSGLYWEYLFSDVRPEPYTMPWMVARHPGAPGETALVRPAEAPRGCLDLGTMANANPELPWLDGMPSGWSLDGFVRDTGGGFRLAHVPFDGRRLVQTAGRESTWDEFKADRGFPGQAYPRASRVLRVGSRSGRRMHVLHATAFRGSPGERVGELELEHFDRPPERIPLVYGENTGWWREVGLRPGQPPAWRGQVSRGAAVLHRLELDLTSGGQPAGVLSVRLRAAPEAAASPFILGVTIDD